MDEDNTTTNLIIDRDGGETAALRFYEDGVETGNVLMNGNNALRIRNKETDQDILFVIDSAGTQRTVMTVDGSRASLGIGTSTPEAKLEVLGPEEANEELIAQFGVLGVTSIDSNYFQIRNETTTAGDFGVMLKAKNRTHSDGPTLMIKAVALNNAEAGDTLPSASIMQFDSRYGGSTTAMKPLFAWTENNNGASRMIMDKNGNVGINTNKPLGKLDVNGAIFANLSTNPTLGNNLVFMDAGEMKEYTSTINHKTEIHNIEFDKEAFLSLRPVDFRWKEAHGGRLDIGLIAEEVEQVMPNMVNYHYKHTYLDATTGEFLRDSTGAPVLDDTELQAWGVDYRKISVYLLALVKEQDSLISDLGQRLAHIESIIESCCNAEPSYRMGGLEEHHSVNGSRLEVYPNPTSGECTVKFKMPNDQRGKLFLVSMAGTRTPLIPTPKTFGMVSFTLSGTAGVYSFVLESEAGEQVATKQVILAK